MRTFSNGGGIATSDAALRSRRYSTLAAFCIDISVR
jgi:hypothetical protein